MKRLLLVLSILFTPSVALGWGVYLMTGGPVVAQNEAFEFVMRTTGASETVTLPFTYTDIDIDWGDGSSVENFTSGTVSHEYATADDYEISVTGSATKFSFLNGGDILKLISVSNLGDLGWTNFTGGFYGCSNMTSFVSGHTDISLVTDMSYMFRGCSSLTSLDLGTLFDTSLVTNMSSMFRSCSSLDIDVSDFDITSLSTAASMFLFSGFSNTNYDLLLVAWEAQTELADVPFHAGTAQYGSGAPATARVALVSSGWIITDGGEQ